MLVRALPLVSPTSETLIAARLGSCPEEWASRVGSRPLERPGPAARAPEGCHISRRAAAAAWPVHPKGRPSARRRQLGGPRRSRSCYRCENSLETVRPDTQHTLAKHPKATAEQTSLSREQQTTHPSAHTSLWLIHARTINPPKVVVERAIPRLHRTEPHTKERKKDAAFLPGTRVNELAC